MPRLERRERADKFDKNIISLFRDALYVCDIDRDSIALIATGGYGRGELFPGSDIDITFVYENINDQDLKKFVNNILFPLWDERHKIDYSIRTLSDLRQVLKSDIKAILGMLDARFIDGSAYLAELASGYSLNQWSSNYEKYLPTIEASLKERYERAGELAFLLEPDLKESRGGLRDITLLHAFGNIKEMPINFLRIEEAESLLSNVREALHLSTNTAKDILYFAEQDKLALSMGFADADSLMLEISKSARAIDFALKRTWDEFNKPKKTVIDKFKKNRTENVGKGLVSRGTELLIEKDYVIDQDPGLGIRAAAIAAQRGLTLSANAIHQLAENLGELPLPWPRGVREDFVALLGAGRHMVEVFETLDQENLIARWIPEWSHVRFLPQRNVLHRHTVDRHMLETVVRASHLTRRVHRPDLLLIAALFHDIGKGYKDRDHSEFGSVLMINIAKRLGFNADDVKILVLLVEHHLALTSAATRRDLDDPQTIADILKIIENANNLELLHALSIADGEATGKNAWSAWKAGLVQDLVQRTLKAISGVPFAQQVELTQEQINRAFKNEILISLEDRGEFIEIEIVVPDRAGLLSTVAGILAISRMDVRSAKTRTIGNTAFMNWLVLLEPHVPVPTSENLLRLLKKALNGEIDLATKIEERIQNYRALPGIQSPAAVVEAVNDAATNATVLEVRMHDRPGVLFNVTRTISRYRVDIRSAVVTTLGAEAIDTLYLTDFHGNALSSEEATLLAQRVENYLLTL